MRWIALGLLLSLVLTSIASPIHSIWNNLPAPPSKRYYGLYHNLPSMDNDRDKRYGILYWTPLDE
ncbi:unnamed protein product [Cylicocyclus nassatus]|uniref:Uncharacterized protein n=1 Tax=Cylicocyclus nassatus TaxID=53992 RepID=A0AA36DK53_CYLNA|nr:unnamed protein product [Cylicocyclus nassatus]